MSVEKLREFAGEASREKLFQKIKEVEVGEEGILSVDQPVERCTVRV